MRAWAKSFWRDDSGQDLVEYTMLLALMALAVAAVFASLQPSMAGIWNRNSNNLNTADHSLN
jgi:Flp pilus assembly pilin Flp